MASGDTKTEALLNILGNGGDASDYKGCCNTKTQSYILDAIDRVQNVEDEVEELKNNPDVVDIVNTYADLQAYDKSTLTDKDIIRVLEDSTHSNKSTYYRYSASTDSFTYIGEAGSSVTVVQTTGTSQTDVMSQNATTNMIYSDTSTQKRIKIGYNAYSTPGDESIEIGKEAKASNTRGIAIGAECKTESGYGIAIGSAVTASGTESVGIGSYARTNGERAIAIGRDSTANMPWSVALGAGAVTSAQGEVNIGTGAYFTTYGYNNSNYRLLSGLYDAQSAHDAVTLGQLNTRLGNLTITTISQSDYNNLQTKDPNTLYLITGA